MTYLIGCIVVAICLGIGIYKEGNLSMSDAVFACIGVLSSWIGVVCIVLSVLIVAIHEGWGENKIIWRRK